MPFDDEKIKVIANIPYYITSPILVHLLGEIDELIHKNRSRISEIVLMVQLEVANRIVANENSQNKEYGQLSILSQMYCDCEIIKKGELYYLNDLRSSNGTVYGGAPVHSETPIMDGGILEIGQQKFSIHFIKD